MIREVAELAREQVQLLLVFTINLNSVFKIIIQHKNGDMETPQHGNWFKISGNRSISHFLMHFHDFFDFFRKSTNSQILRGNSSFLIDLPNFRSISALFQWNILEGFPNIYEGIPNIWSVSEFFKNFKNLNLLISFLKF